MYKDTALLKSMERVLSEIRHSGNSFISFYPSCSHPFFINPFNTSLTPMYNPFGYGIIQESKKGPYFKFPINESKRKMWVQSLEVDEPEKFGANGPGVCKDHFGSQNLKITVSGRWRLSEGAIPLHVVSSITGYEENIYLECEGKKFLSEPQEDT